MHSFLTSFAFLDFSNLKRYNCLSIDNHDSINNVTPYSYYIILCSSIDIESENTLVI